MADSLIQLRRGSLELAVLALLHAEARYGVEIVEALADRAGLEASSGTVYPLLTRLKNSGLVETTWQESTMGPPRKYYALSPAGRARLEEYRGAWETLAATVAGLLKETR
ncbi:MAG: PadR family transcriptional regulator [bacterium]|nr:PadR family transcriptional regulator [bacterium]